MLCALPMWSGPRLGAVPRFRECAEKFSSGFQEKTNNPVVPGESAVGGKFLGMIPLVALVNV